ncbi:MAG: FecR domain-containing protein [Bacteroidales bacterium]|nr:FecR domain-containing protein [Bacteroidales bacterium]
MMRNSLWNLISKYFAGECDEAELVNLHNWISKKESNRLLFNELQRDRELISKYKEMKTVDVDKAWHNLSKRIAGKESDSLITMIPAKNNKPRINAPVLIGLAASVLIIAGLLLTYRSLFTKRVYETIVTSDNHVSLTLPDGSNIFLNRDSKVIYPKKFNSGQRTLNLTGEAFFNVVPDADKPFTVKAGKARIKVIGTSFTVNGRAGNNMIEVYVENGKVSLYKEKLEHTGVMIESGYIGQLAGNQPTKYLNKNDNILAWKTKKIIFSETRLAEVIEVLEKVYGKEIIIENKEALSWPYTGTFNNQDLESVTRVLVENYQFGIEQDRDKIVLTGGNSGI